MKYDLVILGAGPAGIAAAARAAGFGHSVLVLDEQPRAGGQIYRDVGQANSAKIAILGTDYADGVALTKALDHPNITHLTGAVVWQIDPTGEVAFSRNGRAEVAKGERVLIASGALERAMPIPGWTLPGVMTAGAAQILLKSASMVPKRAILVGSGPLLYLIAAQMVRAGAPPIALVETQTRADLLRSLRHLPAALIGWRYLWKGAILLATLRRAGVRRLKAASNIEILGEDHAQAVRFSQYGKTHEIPADAVLLHHGVVPNTQASQSLELVHDWNKRQRAFCPRVDRWGRSSAPNANLRRWRWRMIWAELALDTEGLQHAACTVAFGMTAPSAPSSRPPFRRSRTALPLPTRPLFAVAKRSRRAIFGDMPPLAALARTKPKLLAAQAWGNARAAFAG